MVSSKAHSGREYSAWCLMLTSEGANISHRVLFVVPRLNKNKESLSTWLTLASNSTEVSITADRYSYIYVYIRLSIYIDQTNQRTHTSDASYGCPTAIWSGEITERLPQQLYWSATSSRIVYSRVQPVCQHRHVLSPRGVATHAVNRTKVRR